jgi:hypothetical protein
MDSVTARTQWASQGALQPGTQGWWEVWGASPRHIKPGDLLVDIEDGETCVSYIQDTYIPKNSPLRVGLVIDDARVNIGALCPIVLLRQGSHNFLA